MTIKYIHPYDGSNNNPGTRKKPWKDLTNLSTHDWKEALIARDTKFLVTRKTQIKAVSNRYIGTYGSGSNPLIHHYLIARDWIKIAPNIWMLKIANFWAPVTYLCFGQLGNFGKRVTYFNVKNGQTKKTPSADKEWDTTSDHNKPAILYIYSPENPNKYYGNIYYQTGRSPVFSIHNADEVIIEDINYQHTSTGIKIYNSDNKTHRGCKIINNHANDVSTLASIVSHSGWIDTTEISGCTAKKCHSHAIFLSKYIKNILIQNNQIKHTGLVVSTASIYIGDSFAPVGGEIQISKNRVEGSTYNRYWPVDGAGIYADSNSQNINISQNLVLSSHIGLKSNTGKAGLRIHDNVTKDCDIGYEEGDSDKLDSADTRVYYNNFLNCTLNRLYPDDPLNRPIAAIRYFNKKQINAEYYFYSNEITGNGGRGLSTQKSINEFNNRFINLAT